MKEIDFQHDLLPLKNKLFRVALRITLDRPEAEDVVEDTLVRTWEQRRKLTEIDNLEAYCITVCRNLAIDRAEKKEAQHLSLDHSLTEQADNALGADEKMEQDERLQWIEKLFDRLPEKQRTALQLRDIEGFSYRDVAEMMSISEADVKVTIHRARQTLKQKVEAMQKNKHSLI